MEDFYFDQCKYLEYLGERYRSILEISHKILGLLGGNGFNIGLIADQIELLIVYIGFG